MLEPQRATAAQPDADGDGIVDDLDNCPTVANPDQTDVGADGYGDAFVAPDAVIAPTAQLGANPIIGRACVIGDHASIGDHVVLGEEVRIGPASVVGDYARIGDDAVLGEEVSIGLGVILGHDFRADARVNVADRAVVAISSPWGRTRASGRACTSLTT